MDGATTSKRGRDLSESERRLLSHILRVNVRKQRRATIIVLFCSLLTGIVFFVIGLSLDNGRSEYWVSGFVALLLGILIVVSRLHALRVYDMVQHIISSTQGGQSLNSD